MINKKRLILLTVLFLSLLFVVNEVVAQYYYGSYYGGVTYGRYFGRGGVLSLLDLYYQYPTWFDFAIFLVIFLGLGKAILGERFGTTSGGGKAVYVGIGIFLAFALLLWEEETGFTLIRFGPGAFFILMLVISFYIFKWIKEAIGAGRGGNLVGGSIAYFFIYWYTMSSMGYFAYEFLTYLPLELGPIVSLLNIAAVICFIVGVVHVLSGRD